MSTAPSWIGMVPELELHKLVLSRASLRRRIRDAYLCRAAGMLDVSSPWGAAGALRAAFECYRRSAGYRLALRLGREDAGALQAALFCALQFGPIPRRRQLWTILQREPVVIANGRSK